MQRNEKRLHVTDVQSIVHSLAVCVCVDRLVCWRVCVNKKNVYFWPPLLSLYAPLIPFPHSRCLRLQTNSGQYPWFIEINRWPFIFSKYPKCTTKIGSFAFSSHSFYGFLLASPLARAAVSTNIFIKNRIYVDVYLCYICSHKHARHTLHHHGRQRDAKEQCIPTLFWVRCLCVRRHRQCTV